MLFRSFIVIVLTLPLAGGCEAFDASLLEADAAAGCVLHRPPARPGPEAGGDDSNVHTYAIRDVRLNQSGGTWREIGYDLDGLCSEPPTLEVECRAPAASAPPEEDGVGGTDNSLAHNAFPVVLATRDDFVTRAIVGQTQGLGAVVIQLREWNGEANDAQLEAVLMQTVFGSSEPFELPIGDVDVSEEMLRVDGVLKPPNAWAGGDHFFVHESGFLDGNIDRPTIVDNNAYISDDTLVMRLPDRFPFYLGGDENGVRFALTDVTFTVRFAGDHQRIDVAILAGRWSIPDVLEGLRAAGICPATADYAVLTRLLDLSADVRSIPGTGGPGVACDAVSLGLAFDDGVRANVAGVHPGFPVPSPCD